MVYVVDLDDTLVLTKNLNNDAYNYALEQNGQRRIKTNKRLTRENFGETDSKKLITDKQNYFAQKWLKYRVVVNEEILNLLKNQDKENCYLWTSADKNRADFILKELKRLNKKIVITSDCHNANFLDCQFEECEKILKSVGFDEIYSLTGGKFVAQKIQCFIGLEL